MKTLLGTLVAALAVAPAAFADGPPDYAAVYGSGVARGTTHYVVVPGGVRQSLLAVVDGGSIQGARMLNGYWGVPTIAYNHGTGLSQNGKRLFLENTALSSRTSFLVMSTPQLKQVDRFTLRGAFSFDALSPDASRLYLIQRVDANDFSRYVVRAYDLRTHRLLPGRIADRTQRNWVMRGSSVTRTEGSDGRWVYTLYTNPGGFPFIHALDTVRGVAHCVGLPWPQTRSQDGMWSLGLQVRGGVLDVTRAKGGTLYRVDTTTWAVRAAPGRGFPWWWSVFGGSLALFLAMELVRRRRRNTPVSVQGGSDGPAARVRLRSSLRRGSRSSRRLPVTVRSAGR